MKVAYFKAGAERIAPYLPSNYIALQTDEGRCAVIGTDHAGWTWREYVQPRLASGMYWPDRVVDSLQAEQEATHLLVETQWGHGIHDEACGSVDGPDGHHFRVDRYIVHTDSQGNLGLIVLPTARDAEDLMRDLDRDRAEDLL